MYRVSLFTGLVVAVLGVGFMTAQDKTAKGPDREADKQAIDKLIKEHDPGVQQPRCGRDRRELDRRGRVHSQRRRADPRAGRDPEGVRGVFQDAEGQAEAGGPDGRPSLPVGGHGRFGSHPAAEKRRRRSRSASSWRNTLLVREGGQWKVAIVQEWDRDDGLDVSLKELEWLIGTWHVATKDREVTTTYEWDENKAFIRGKYTVKEGAKVVESGTQMIGKDNAEGAIRSWVFQSDGGFGDGLWTRDGKKWTVDFYGVTPDGRELTATVIYIHVDANTYTWQVGRPGRRR